LADSSKYICSQWRHSQTMSNVYLISYERKSPFQQMVIERPTQWDGDGWGLWNQNYGEVVPKNEITWWFLSSRKIVDQRLVPLSTKYIHVLLYEDGNEGGNGECHSWMLVRCCRTGYPPYLLGWHERASFPVAWKSIPSTPCCQQRTMGSL